MLIETCGASAVGFTTVKQCELFMEGHGGLEDVEKSGRPVAVHDDKMNVVIITTLLDKDRRMMQREMEGESGIPTISVHRILTDVLRKCKLLVQWVPHFQRVEQKAEQMYIAQELLTRCYANEDELFLQQIITMDETWIRNFELELKS